MVIFKWRKSGSTITLRTKLRGSSFFEFLIIIYMLWIPLLQLINISVIGMPLFSVFFIALSCVCFWLVGIHSIRVSKYIYILFLLATVVAFFVSVLRGFGLSISLYNDFLYTTPILFLILSEFINFDMKKICRYVQYMTCIAGLISIMIYMGIIDSGLNYRISITLVDNTIGLFGLSVSIYLIISSTNKMFAWFTALMSLIILLTGQSRARIILGVLIIFLYLIYIFLVKKGGKGKSLTVVLIVTVIVAVFVNRNIGAISEYLGLLMGKFQIIGEDTSSAYRLAEIQVHFELFMEHPLLGIGCGALNSNYNTRIDSILYGHSMFTVILAVNGIIYFIVFLSVFINMVIKVIYCVIKNKKADDFLAFILTILLLVLGITSSGFGKPTTHIMILVVGVILNNKKSSQYSNVLCEKRTSNEEI